MKRIINRGVALYLLSACVSAHGYTNPIEGGSSQTVSNQWTVSMPWLMVGSNTEGNSLVVDGGQVENQIGYIGNAAASSNNSAIVTGAGSVWSNSTELSVGKDGAGNALSVVDGGRVDAATAYVGNNSSGNSASVDGSGSLLNTPTLHVGHLGSGNNLNISNGGKVETTNGTIGYWLGADNNTATVQGSNALWQSSASINVGDAASGNQLAITDGGHVESPVINLGVQSTASNNMLSISGNGALLDAPEIHIGGSSAGEGGTGNRIEVASGGTVATTSLDIYAGNSFELNNGGSLAVSTNFNASMSGFNFNAGGTLEIGGELTGMDSSIEDQRSVVLNGSNAVWDQEMDTLEVGARTDGNRVIIKNGGSLRKGFGVIGGSGYIGGFTSNTDSNAVWVSGTGSVWKNGTLFIGYGTGNSLIIEDGGKVNSTSSGWIGASDAAKENMVLVTGLGSEWNISSGLDVGAVGEGNQLIISNGAHVVNGGIGTIGNASSSVGNSVQITDMGSAWYNEILTVGYGGSQNSLSILNGGFVSDYTSYIGYASGADSNSVLVAGAGSVWQNNEALYLGGYKSGTGWIDGGTGNSLVVSNGGWVQVGDLGTNNLPEAGSLGVVSVGGIDGAEMVVANGSRVESDLGHIGFDAGTGGSVTVTGAGSVWDNAGDMDLGGGGSGSLRVAEGGLVSVDRDMRNRNGSIVNIETDGHVAVAGNYYQDASSVLRFGVETNEVGAPLNPFVSVGGTAEFEEGATLQYHSNVGVLEFDTFYTNLIVEANQLIIGGVTNANALDLEAINLDGSLVDVLLWEDDQNIYGLVGRQHLADSAGFEADSMMAGVSGELDDLSLLGNPEAVQQINLLSDMSSDQQNAQLTQRYSQGTPTYRHRQSMQGGQRQILAQSRAFQSANRAQGAKPQGAAGPHEAEQGLRGWVRGYGTWAQRDSTGSFSGFDQDVYGTILGLDRAFGNVLLGAAGGYSSSDLTQDNNDTSDAKTGYGMLYASWGTVDWFGDLSLGYGRSAIENHSGTALGGTSDFDADHYSVYFGIGKEMRLQGNGLILTPEAAMNIAYYDQEGYQDGLMNIDDYSRWCYQSRLGAALAVERQTGSVVWKPEVRAYWLHEFSVNPDEIGYTLGGSRFTFGVQAPDEEILDAGIGLGITVHNLELVFDLDGQYSAHYTSATAGAHILYEF